ncbi:MAG TPA: sialate O-acetylesterase [Paludibacteraceae bacterium]|nr:sialate O-acetylesterase [Paludibacteraceae bacterium]
MRRLNLLFLLVSFCWNSFAQGFGGTQTGDLAGFTSKTDIDYVGDNIIGHKLDIYYPHDDESTHPVLIHIYGSAWTSNSGKGSADLGTVGKAALDAGYIFVTPNHRSASDAKWPSQSQDIKACIRYLRGNAATLKIDTSFIAISGFSSGGHLASIMGTTRGGKEFTSGSITYDLEGSLGKFTDFSSSVDAVCDWSGPVDLMDMQCDLRYPGAVTPMRITSMENDLIGADCDKSSCPDRFKLVSAPYFISSNTCPFFIAHGSADNVVPQCQGIELNDKLKAAGIYTEYYGHSGSHGVASEHTGDMVNFLNKMREEKAAQGGGTLGGDTSGDPKDRFHVYIAIGQSNMWGNATVTESDKITNDRIKMMSTAKSRGNIGSWIPAVPPMCAPSAGYSLSDNFIRVMAEKMPECVTIGIIPVAIAGASFKAFDPNQCSSYFSSSESWLQNMAKEYDNNPYNRIVECAKKAQETGVIKGIIVHQGESDSGQQSWLDMVTTFYNNICKELNLDPAKTPILVGQMLENGACAGHNSVIALLPSRISNCGIVETSGLPGESDRLHFTHDSYTKLGQRYAEKMVTMFDTTGTASGCVAYGGGGPIIEPTQEPYEGTAADVPGKVEAENFDEGGEGVAYSDSDTNVNDGTISYRSESVDFVSGNGGTAIGYTTTSEWLEYTINVKYDGEYSISAVMSNGSSDPSISIAIDGKTVTSITASGAGDWDTYATGEAADKVALTAGEHIMKVSIAAANTNIDYIEFKGEDTEVDELFSNGDGIFLAPNPAKNNFSVISSKEIVKVEVLNTVGQTMLAPASAKNINLAVPAGMYFVKAYAADGSSYVAKLQVK